MGYFFDVIYITASRTNHYTTEVAGGNFLLTLLTNCLYRSRGIALCGQMYLISRGRKS